MSVQRLWQRLVRVGIDGNTSVVDAKYIMLLNGCTMLIGLATATALPVIMLFDRTPSAIVGSAVILAMLAGVLWLNSLRRHSAAAQFLLLIGIFGLLSVFARFGPKLGVHYSLLPLALLAWLLFPARSYRLCFIYSGLFLGLFGLVVLLFPLLLRLPWAKSPQPAYFVQHVTLCVLAICLFSAYSRQVAIQTEAALSIERGKTDGLLAEMLPHDLAAALRSGQTGNVFKGERVGVLVSDLVGFTALSEDLSAEELVALLNRIFSDFDDICERHGARRVKVVGDSYIAAVGLFSPEPARARPLVELGLEMLECVNEISADSGVSLQIRIGIAIGPAMAGVLGSGKLVFDLWGEAVNVAQSMESSGEPNAVQLAEPIQLELAETIACTPRGEILVEGVGNVRRYLIKAPSFSSEKR